MAELSPTAQKVFWAFNEAASGKPDDWHYLPAIAAALEAAVNRLSYGHGSWAGESPIIDADELLAIAAELKAHD